MILAFGRTGQVATELLAHGDVIALGRDEADLSDPAGCAAAILARRPRAVINAAAYTAVDRAEDEEAIATAINGEAPGAMARAAADVGARFIHISTDYVFSGDGAAAWKPTDKPAPIGAYGRSKLHGEHLVAASGAAHVILRTSWVFSAHGSNFVRTMLRLGAERDCLSVVADQVGGPTPASDIASACLRLARSDGPSGCYHFSGAPDVSWADFAREIFRQAGLGTEVRDIPSSDYPTPARRPLNSRLDCGSLERDYGISRPDWRKGLARILGELRD